MRTQLCQLLGGSWFQTIFPQNQLLVESHPPGVSDFYTKPVESVSLLESATLGVDISYSALGNDDLVILKNYITERVKIQNVVSQGLHIYIFFILLSRYS